MSRKVAPLSVDTQQTPVSREVSVTTESSGEDGKSLADDQLLKIKLASLSDFGYVTGWVTNGTNPLARGDTIREVNIDNVFVTRYLGFFSTFSTTDDQPELQMELRFASVKYEDFRSGFIKTSCIMALGSLTKAGLSAVDRNLLQCALYAGIIFPIYVLFAILTRCCKDLYYKLCGNRSEWFVVALLGVQSILLTFSEFYTSGPGPENQVPTFRFPSIHMAFLHNFLPISYGRICFISACTTLAPYLVLSSCRQLYDSPEYPHLDDQCRVNEDTWVLREIILPCVVFLGQFILTAWRDENMRLDLLMRQRLRERRRQLDKEMKKGEDLLKSMLPELIIECLKDNEPVEPIHYESVTVIFVQVCDFGKLCSELLPETSMVVLNTIYSELDRLSDLLHVHKVETVMDVYMAVVGAPDDCVINHAEVAAHFALAAQASVAQMTQESGNLMLTLPKSLKIRIGLNTGSIRAGVVGIDKPRYKLFGDTVNIASRMESTCDPGHIQLSMRTKEELDDSRFRLHDRGEVAVKGKGTLQTFYLIGYGSDHDHMDAETFVTVQVSKTDSTNKRSKWGKAATMRSIASPTHSARPLKRSTSFHLPGLSKMADKAMKDVIAAVDISHGERGTTQAFGGKELPWLWYYKIEKFFLMVPKESRTPEFLNILSRDNQDFLNDTIDRRQAVAVSLTLIWEIWIAAASGVDSGFMFQTDETEYLLYFMFRTWGLQISGLMYLVLIVNKKRFNHWAPSMTVFTLLLQGIGTIGCCSTVFRREPAIVDLFGLYVLFNSACSIKARLSICLLTLIAYTIIHHQQCAAVLDIGGYGNFMLFILTASGLRMQEHLERCANYYQRHVEKNIQEISRTKSGSSSLLANLLPPHIVELVNQEVSPIAEPYKDVTIIFTDIKGFTAYCSKIQPMELVDLLNSMYSAFDEIILNWGLHKVEVIGDAYFISAGCPLPPDQQQASLGEAEENALRAVEVALALLRTLPAVCEDPSVQMRVGLHTGDVIAGVVGKKGPRFQLFGPTVDYANFMESSGIPGRVHISNVTHQWLKSGGHDYEFSQRHLEVGGEEHCSWLVTKSKAKAARKIQTQMAMQRQSMNLPRYSSLN
mmetsp:Transcript_74235/g.131275  ORF Transcript_74235/g.131275 Transcript_74235/m.131275 type:complete len:1100 (-) Transcript_74235:267-3566(-)